MADEYTTLKAYIKTQLTAITGLKYVYGYEKGDLAGYPACTIVGFSVASPLETTSENLRAYTFKIRVFQEINEDSRGAEDAETVIDNLVDTIITKFDNDYHLGDNCEMSLVAGTLGWIDRELSMRVIDIDLICQKLVTVS